MSAEISAAIASAKIALDIAKTAKSLSNYNELVSAFSEVNTKLVDATVVALASLDKQSSLSSEISELKEKLRNIENWESQMKRYRLHELPSKALTYAMNPGMEDGQPPHYLCTTCVNQGKKTILQPKENTLFCQLCKSNIFIHTQVPIDFTNSSARGHRIV